MKTNDHMFYRIKTKQKKVKKLRVGRDGTTLSVFSHLFN
jgi:hypothetical protein